MNPIGRAQTPEEKRMIVTRLLEAWVLVPELRLGQLIENVLAHDVGANTGFLAVRLFQAEDEAFVAMVEQWVRARCP